jgi:branched-chain amino acid transport system substrate-binding protein
MVMLAACGGSSNGGSGGGKPASGEPILIGLINQEGVSCCSTPGLREGTEAAVKYINAELNGVGGRPIKLQTCITNSSPESSASCANQMVEHKVVAVRGGVDFGTAASLPILHAAGIPYVGGSPLLSAEFTSQGVFALDPGGLGNAGSAVYIADKLKAKRVAILHTDGPGRQLAENFVKQPLLNRGIAAANIKMTAEKVDAADVSAAVAAASQGNPDAIVVVFPPPSCARVMQAAAALGVKTPMFYIGLCADPEVLKAAGAAADGVYFFTPFLNVEANADDADVRLYLDKIRTYGPPAVDSASFDLAVGFANTMTVYKRLTTLDPASITPATVTAAFRAAVGAPGFMTHAYTCDGKQAIPAFVSLCNTYVRIYQFTGGHYRDMLGDWVSAGAALKR